MTRMDDANGTLQQHWDKVRERHPSIDDARHQFDYPQPSETAQETQQAVHEIMERGSVADAPAVVSESLAARLRRMVKRKRSSD